MGNDAKKQPLIGFWLSFLVYIVTFNFYVFSYIFLMLFTMFFHWASFHRYYICSMKPVSVSCFSYLCVKYLKSDQRFVQILVTTVSQEL